MGLTLRYMRLADIPQVVTIDNLSFNPPWSARSYAYEVAESTYSHMVVLEEADDNHSHSILRRLLSGPRETLKRIVAYGGLWHISDEAHISTIATHPDFRGRGWGEVVLAGMVQKALFLRASYIVLEVRVSNKTAQNLYTKYGFQIVDVKKGYYHNDGEDAYDMRLDLLDQAVRAKLTSRLNVLKGEATFVDEYSQNVPTA